MGIEKLNIAPLVKHDKEFPFWVVLNTDNNNRLHEIKEWCKEYCKGRRLTKRFNQNYKEYYVVFFFTEEDDLLLFKLTWG